jgi:hypothetical protein|tara:strand:- start:341 stop:502 length:162 start_codon:yes stop_codon:yes gene_type:complete
LKNLEILNEKEENFKEEEENGITFKIYYTARCIYSGLWHILHYRGMRYNGCTG